MSIGRPSGRTKRKKCTSKPVPSRNAWWRRTRIPGTTPSTWAARYLMLGLKGWADKGRRPPRCPGSTRPPQAVKKVLAREPRQAEAREYLQTTLQRRRGEHSDHARRERRSGSPIGRGLPARQGADRRQYRVLSLASPPPRRAVGRPLEQAEDVADQALTYPPASITTWRASSLWPPRRPRTRARPRVAPAAGSSFSSAPRPANSPRPRTRDAPARAPTWRPCASPPDFRMCSKPWLPAVAAKTVPSLGGKIILDQDITLVESDPPDKRSARRPAAPGRLLQDVARLRLHHRSRRARQ